MIETHLLVSGYYHISYGPCNRPLRKMIKTHLLVSNRAVVLEGRLQQGHSSPLVRTSNSQKQE